MKVIAIPLAAILIPMILSGAELSSAPPPRSPPREALAPTQAERDARLPWWREARFEMFVRWCELRVSARDITGQELMRLRELALKPVAP